MRSLRARIIAWSFVPTSIILLAVALLSLYAQQRNTERLVIDRDQELTCLSATLLAADLTSYIDPLSDRYLLVFDSVVFFDANGRIVSESPDEYAWLRGTLLRRLLNSPGLAFSDVIVNGFDGEAYIVAAMPVSNRAGELREGMAGTFLLVPRDDSPLYQSIERLRRDESSVLYLADSRGRLIYHSDPRLVGSNFASQPVIQRLTAGESGALRTRDLGGRQIVASFCPVPGTTWGLVVEESWASLTQASWRYQQMLLLLLVLGIVAPTLIVTVGVRRIVRPITEITGAAQEIAGGNFNQRIGAPAAGELNALAEQFNIMAGELQGSYAHLEQKVQDRTRHLAALNAIAAEVNRSLDLDEILNMALDRILDVTGFSKGLAYRLDEETGQPGLLASRGLAGQPVILEASDLACGPNDPWQPVVRQISAVPPGRTNDWLAAEGLETLICAPLMAKGRPVGVVVAGGQSSTFVSPEVISLLTAIGHQVGMAVENARLYGQAQQLAVVKERNRLAHDLHDSVTQALFGVTLCVEAAARQLSSGNIDRVDRHLHEIQGITQEALGEMRLLIFELRPPLLAQAGLAGALRSRLEAVEERAGLETEFHVDEDGRLPPHVEEGLYRVAQEALNNVLKHAHASHVRITLRGEGTMTVLEIADDGAGFNPDEVAKRGGLGLRGMQERAAQLGGKLTIESSPGGGTKIRVEVCR